MLAPWGMSTESMNRMNANTRGLRSQTYGWPILVRHWEIIADNLSNTGWSWGCFVGMDSEGRDIFVVDAHRDGQRFVVRSDEELTAFLELERAVRQAASGAS